MGIADCAAGLVIPTAGHESSVFSYIFDTDIATATPASSRGNVPWCQLN